MTSSKKGSQNAADKLGIQIGKIEKITTFRGDPKRGARRGANVVLIFFIRILDLKRADRQTVKFQNGLLNLKFGTRPNSRSRNPKIEVPDP